MAAVDVRPVRLSLDSIQGLLIEWSDGQSLRYAISSLREKCPCATCRERRSQPPAPQGLLPILSAAETRPLGILAVQPVGHYAYSFKFSDGHDTGIYSLSLLRELGQPVSS